MVTEAEEGGEEKATKKKTMSPKEIDAAWKVGDIRAHLTGSVNEVCVKPGDEVSYGQVLIVLEAMKMLNNITSEVNGTVAEVYVGPGDKVAIGDPLMFITRLQ